MKKYYVLFFFICSFNILTTYAQVGEWTWMSGDSIPAQMGVFGTQGIPSPANHPPGLYEPCEWVDQQGNLWLFGGIGTSGIYSDLWKYDVSTFQWTWVNGTSFTGQAPSYGTLGVSSPLNHPGNRAYGIICWTDANNTLWLFGGWNSSDNNDLWKYDIATNEWTWMNGDPFTGSPGVYGTLGVSSPLNYPPARLEVACSWIGSSNDLWLFGGEALGGHMNDLWKYDIVTGEWTWMNGSNTLGAVDVYGTMGVSDPLNTPGARQCYTHFKDLSGNFWLFGGTAYNPSSYNDLWKYDPAINEWTWMSGANFQSDPGNYGVKCVASATNLPAYRYENRSCWTDQCGNFYMFGGVGAGVYNDLWYYNVAANMWTWVSGENILNSQGLFGTQGISSALNVPPSRTGSSSWLDANGNLWLFGGFSSGFQQWNDLWRFVPDPACSPCNSSPVAAFSAPNHICPGTCTEFNNLSMFATSYLWSFPGGSPNVSTDVNPTNICYSTPGSYPVTLIAINAADSDTLVLNNYITVYPFPLPQGILQSGDTLFANAGAVSYQWYMNGIIIPGATDYFYVALTSGNYNVVATDLNNCEVEAAIFDVIAAVAPLSMREGSGVNLYPNPVTESLFLGSDQTYESLDKISIYNVIGEKVMDISPVGFKGEIDCRTLQSGIYWLNIKMKGLDQRLKFIKE